MEAKIHYQKGHRLRMFAGQNGSGKSTIFNQIESSSYDIGVYLNADDLEVQLKTLEFIELNKFGIHNINPQEFYDFIRDRLLKAGKKISFETCTPEEFDVYYCNQAT